MNGQEIQDIVALSAEISALDGDNRSQAQALARIIQKCLDECGPTLRRQGYGPILDSTADGEETSADWSGLNFAGCGRKQRHTGRGDHSTRCWAVYGEAWFVSGDGMVRHVQWDGDATDFSGPGYYDRYTAEVEETPLIAHLEYFPESAQEIVTALYQALEKDETGARGRKTRIGKIIAGLTKEPAIVI